MKGQSIRIRRRTTLGKGRGRRGMRMAEELISKAQVEEKENQEEKKRE